MILSVLGKQRGPRSLLEIERVEFGRKEPARILSDDLQPERLRELVGLAAHHALRRVGRVHQIDDALQVAAGPVPSTVPGGTKYESTSGGPKT